MKRSTPAWLAAGVLATLPALAQQPAPPEFAPSNLTPAGVRALAANCAACHGTQGKTVAGSPVPGLAGTPREAIITAMKDFAEGKRSATLMHQIAKGYTAEETAAMADYFSKLPR